MVCFMYITVNDLHKGSTMIIIIAAAMMIFTVTMTTNLLFLCAKVF